MKRVSAALRQATRCRGGHLLVICGMPLLQAHSLLQGRAQLSTQGMDSSNEQCCENRTTCSRNSIWSAVFFCHRDCNGSVSCCRQQQPCSCQSEAYRRFGIQRMDHVFCRLVSEEFTTEQAGAKVLRCSRVRGRQMNAEASISRGKAILFLHADAHFPDVFV